MPYKIHEERLQTVVRMLIEDAGYAGAPSFNDGRFAEEEKYKYRVYADARRELDYGTWSASEIGSGRILTCVKRVVAANGNLVDYSNLGFR